MARKCEACKILEKYRYWNELPPPKSHYFFKIMPDNFEHQLFLPKKFTECFQRKLLGWSTLIGPNGNKWRVEISRAVEDENRLVFLNGWDSFVRDHHIGFRDFLVFRYVGHLSFEVLIFDGSGCEREGAHFATNGSTSQSTCSSTLHTEKIRRSEVRRQISEEQENDSMFEGSKEEETGEASMESSSEETDRHFFRPNIRKSNRVKQPQMCYISNRRKLKEGEKERALRKADAYKLKAGVPVVQITMRATYVYTAFNLTIPKGWALEHMLHESHEVKLQVPPMGRNWIVGCRWTTASDQCQLSANWPTFVLDNMLEEGDVCKFELVKKGNSGTRVTPVFNVYIYRVVDPPSPLTVGRKMV